MPGIAVPVVFLFEVSARREANGRGLQREAREMRNSANFFLEHGAMGRSWDVKNRSIRICVELSPYNKTKTNNNSNNNNIYIL